ncbi:hypothetical protein [Azospirillum brasilense]|nr:hypothetical protein [Azospirillum brasilense]
MKTDPQNTMILSEVRGESAPGEPPQDTHVLMVSRSPADVLDLQGRCAVLAETGGDGAVEAGVIGDTFDWLFGISDVDPLAAYGESGEEGDSEQAIASGANPPTNGNVASRLKLLEDAFATTIMTGNGMIALAKSLGTSLKQAEADRDAMRNETMTLCEVVNRLVGQACAAHAREDALRGVLRFDPTTYPTMEAAAVEWAGKLSVDPVSLLEACEAIAAAALNGEQPAPALLQQRIHDWMLACFGAEVAADKLERNHRFLEEALELVQACGCSQGEAHQLVDYVFGRPVGELAQEVGGVMVTLAALCQAQGIDMAEAGETELARVWTKVEAIRAKQASKPKGSPLPTTSAGEDR